METFTFFGYSPQALRYNPEDNTFMLDPDYSFATGRVKIEVQDDDKFFDGDRGMDEVGEDANQIGYVHAPDGTGIAKGTIYVEQVGILEGPNGETIVIDRIEVEGQHVGYVPSQPIEKGVVYKLIGESDVDDNFGGVEGGTDGTDNRMTYDYYMANSVPCFGMGTRILTPQGPIAVEELRPGMSVVTLDDGPQPVLWISQTEVDLTAPVSKGERPVQIAAPDGPLIVSGNHRALLSDPRAELLFGAPEVLVMAKDLVRFSKAVGVGQIARIRYFHLLLETHHVIQANGAWMESLLATDRILRDAPALVRARVTNPLADAPARHCAARPCLKQGEAAVLLSEPAPPGLAA